MKYSKLPNRQIHYLWNGIEIESNMNRNKEERKTIYPSSNLKRKKEKEKRVGKLSIPARSFLACNQTASRIFPGENFRLARSVHGTSKVLFPRKEKRLSRIFTVDFEPRPTTLPSAPFSSRTDKLDPLSQSPPFHRGHTSIHAYRSREWLWQSIQYFFPPLPPPSPRRENAKRLEALVNALAGLSDWWSNTVRCPPLCRAFFTVYSRGAQREHEESRAVWKGSVQGRCLRDNFYSRCEINLFLRLSPSMLG